MSISGVMKTATSGMGAQSNRLGTIADNIANANTNGYKRAYNEFSSFIPNRTSTEYVSGSVMSAMRNAIDEQGNLTYTTAQTDLAITGKGFFLVSNSDGEVFLTRAGSFVKDGNGDLINAAGYYLMGYPITNGVAATPVSNGTEGLQRIRLTDLVMEASLSDQGAFFVNLPTTATAIAAGSLPSDNVAGSQYSAKTSLVVYAAQGTQVTLDLYWAKTAADTWELTVFNQADATNGGFPYGAAGSAPIATASPVLFNHATGALISPTSIDINVPDGAGDPLVSATPLTLNLSQSSQLAYDYTVVDAHVNGSGPSAVDHVEFSKEGVMYAIYQNGARVSVFNIPLANVPSPNNLMTLPGDAFAPDHDSGDLLIGVPGQGGYGLISGGALEQSTVDLATELSDMIEAERHYQMNSKVFQTGADILDVLVNLKR